MKVYNDDEEPIVASQTQDVSSGDKGSSSQTDRIKVNIIKKLEAPLEETKFKVMLELIGNKSGNNRPGLDLVTVLDRSMSMKGEKLEKMKLAMQLVIKKLSPIDRLSVVRFCGHSDRLCPLRPMTENSKAEIEMLVNNIAARGKTNIYDGLKMGLDVLNQRIYTSGRVKAIVLLSDSPQDQQYKDAAQLGVDSVPVYTFGLGTDYDPKVLNAIAQKSSGGKFIDVQNPYNLSEAFSQCLAGFLSVAVQELKVTFTQKNSIITNVPAGIYSQSNYGCTVLLGALYEKEVRKVIVDLLLPAVSSPQDGMIILEITQTYSVEGKVMNCRPIIAVVNRIGISQEPEKEEVKIEEIRLQTAMKIKEARIMADENKLENAKNIIVEAQTRLENAVDPSRINLNQLIKMLKSELQQLLDLMETQDIYDNLGHSFALSCETFHDRGFAAKGPSSSTKVRIINKTEAPLTETKFKVMLELTGNESGNQRPRLDLVTVLDVSGSMQGEKLEKMKIAMQLVIKKLSPIDRLSVVTFSSDSKSLCPLTPMIENSRAKIEKLVDSLQAQGQGPGDVSAGLEMGLKVLKDRNCTSGRVVAIMLLSDGGQNPEVEVEVSNVPIFTFGLGTDPKLLKSIAVNSSGGKFKNVQNLDNLREESSQCAARLLTVAVQDLKVTIKQVNSAIKNVYAGNYPQSRDDGVGSVTVSFGNLYKKEPQEVKVGLLLHDVRSTQLADILEISYAYSFEGELIRTKTIIVTITRRNSTLMIKEARKVTDKQLEVASKMINEAQKLLEKGVDETLNSEVQQLKRLMNSQKLYKEQESEEVTIDEIHLLTAEREEGTIRSLEVSTVHSNNHVKKFPIEFLLDRTVVRQRIPESLNRRNNYADWSEKVKSYLEELNVWKVIEEPPIETTESIENVDMVTAIKKLSHFRENWMALILINQACGFPINLQIIDRHYARAAWETLAKNWKQGGGEMESFLSAAERRNWKRVENLLDSNQGLAIPSSQNILHLASQAGEVNIVKKLVALMVPQDLEIQDKDGYTALAKASINGDTRIAECMVERNRRLVSIPTGANLLPVVIAVMYGNKEMTTYLYSVTPEEVLANEDYKINGATLLTYSMRMQFHDISFDLIIKYPRLVVALDHYGQSALYQLASMSSAFPSGSELKFWQKWMYHCVSVPDIDWNNSNTSLSFPNEDVSQNNWWNAGYRGVWKQIASRLLTVLGIKHIYEMKLVHHQSFQLLRLICQQINYDLDHDEINAIINALHEAVARGVVELIVGVLNWCPELRWLCDKEGSTIFMKAVQFRQANVFCLIHEFPDKDKMMVLVDHSGENILHKLKNRSIDKTSTIKGLIKIQKELKWSEEIKSMMPIGSLEKKNDENTTAQELVDESHRQLRSNAEEGMKATADSGIIVGILVVTIMFAAAFTVPGGINEDTGLPLFLKKKLFKIFIISDAISLCFSTISVLMFLAILTSRYAKNDFLKPLPRKMIIALSTLFISLTAMMIAFAATLFIMLRTEFWIGLPIIVLLTSLPIIFFVALFFPLLSECVMSTYGPSIFKRKSKLM